MDNTILTAKQARFITQQYETTQINKDKLEVSKEIKSAAEKGRNSISIPVKTLYNSLEIDLYFTNLGYKIKRSSNYLDLLIEW